MIIRFLFKKETQAVNCDQQKIIHFFLITSKGGRKDFCKFPAGYKTIDRHKRNKIRKGT